MPRSALLLAIVLCTGFGGCRKESANPPTPQRDAGQDPVKLREALLAKTRQIVEILKGATDETSANAAAAKIQTMRNQMLELAGEFKDLRRPTAEEAKRIADVQRELAAVSAQIEVEKKRLASDPKLVAAKDAAEELDRAMQEASKNED